MFMASAVTITRNVKIGSNSAKHAPIAPALAAFAVITSLLIIDLF